MKKILSILLIFGLFYFPTVFAAENSAQQVAEDNKAVIALQKQPTNEAQKQKITRNIACIVIQINGKVKDEVVNRQ